jgi:hypothetical protein
MIRRGCVRSEKGLMMVQRSSFGRVSAERCTQCDGPLDKEYTIEMFSGEKYVATTCSFECRDALKARWKSDKGKDV